MCCRSQTWRRTRVRSSCLASRPRATAGRVATTSRRTSWSTRPRRACTRWWTSSSAARGCSRTATPSAGAIRSRSTTSRRTSRRRSRARRRPRRRRGSTSRWARTSTRPIARCASIANASLTLKVYDRALEAGAGLRHLGLSKDTMFNICSTTKPEWMIMAFGACSSTRPR